MATTPCPRCQAALLVRGERGSCPACGQAVRFVEAPEVMCRRCGGRVPHAGGDVAKCGRCGAWTATDAARPLRGQATCPRCRRALEVPLDAESHDCPHCGSSLLLRDTL